MGDVVVAAAGSESRIEAKLDALLVTTTRIEAEITSRGKQIDDHEQRLRDHDTQLADLKAAQATAGKFSWGDVGKVLAALVAGGVLLTMFVSLVLTLAPQS